MLGRLRLVALAVLITSCTAARAQAPSPREELQKRYVDFLKSEGYSPEVNSDGNVVFKYEGGRYLIILDPKDRNFFQLVFGGFWKIESDADRQKAMAAASQAMLRSKFAKIIVMKSGIVATVEQYVKEPGEVSVFFRRAVGGLQYSVRAFAEEMSKK
jgi:hypothetical protein